MAGAAVPRDEGAATGATSSSRSSSEVEGRDDGTEVRLRRSPPADRRAGGELAPALGAGDVAPSSVST